MDLVCGSCCVDGGPGQSAKPPIAMRLPPEMIITNSRTRVRPDHTSVDLVGRAFWHGSGCACVDIVRGFCCVDLVVRILCVDPLAWILMWIVLCGSCDRGSSCMDLVVGMPWSASLS